MLAVRPGEVAGDHHDVDSEDEEDQEDAFYVVDYPSVPVRSAPSPTAEIVAWLRGGDLVEGARRVGRRVSGGGADGGGGGEWLRLRPGARVRRAGAACGGGPRLAGGAGSGSSAGSSSGDSGCGSSCGSEDESAGAPVAGGSSARPLRLDGLAKDDGEPVAGYAPERHGFLGTLLRYAGAARTAPGPAGAPPAAAPGAAAPGPGADARERREALARLGAEGAELPDEADEWSRAQLERFLVSQQPPRWLDVASEAALGLHGLSDDQVEENLRTAVLWLAHADAVLVASGAGLGADAGLPTLAGCRRGRHAWPGLRALNLEYEDACDPARLPDRPRLAWACWRHYGSLYAAAASEPHDGYGIVRAWAEQAPLGAFAITCSVDGHWAASGWPEDRLLEAHGSAHLLQCSRACGVAPWPAPANLGLVEDRETHEVRGELPRCPDCGALARPWMRLPGAAPCAAPSAAPSAAPFDEAALAGRRSAQEAWLQEALPHQQQPPDAAPRLVCLEIGCSPGSTPRRAAEDALARAGAAGRLVRIGSRHCAAAAACAGRAVALPLRALGAIHRLERLRRYVKLRSYIVEDSEGNGAEVLAPEDAFVSHVFRKATADTGDAFDWGASGAGPRFAGQHVLFEDKGAVEAPWGGRLPAALGFVVDDGEPAVVRLRVSGFSFSARNKRLRDRVERASALVKDLIEGYQSPDYQERLAACADRAAVLQMVKEIHFRVLPSHGFPLAPGASAAEAAARTAQMQALLMSAKCERWLGQALEWSLVLSGYNKLASLPLAKVKPSADARTAKAVTTQALVVAQRPGAGGAGASPGAPGPGRAPAAEDRWSGSHRPPTVLWIAGTWCNFEPREMQWDGSCFAMTVEIGRSGRESFQLLLGGRWEAAIYPSVNDSSPSVDHKLLGPDSRGHGKNWTIGKDGEDAAAPGCRVRVAVAVDARGAPRRVAWQREGAAPDRGPPPGARALAGPAELVGRWRYGTKEYRILERVGAPLFFEGPHSTHGTVVGELRPRPRGPWLQAELRPRAAAPGAAAVGDIRICLLAERDTAVSNYRGASKAEWGRDISAQRVSLQP